MRKATPTAAQRRAEDAVIRRALRLLEDRLEYGPRDVLGSPQAVRDFLRLRMSQLEHEVFFALWLNAQNGLTACEELSRGTLTQVAVFPREVVKSALTHNAAAVIFAHNHPSGLNQPSRADEVLTTSLKQALALIDVNVLDHFIVSGAKDPFSFSEHGLL